MRNKDVPQDSGILDRWHEIAYALDDDGRYVLTPCAGWEAANTANLQAWEVIAEAVEAALAGVAAGELSPLAFHMAVNQMDAGLLSRYAGIARWRVRRHLRPAVWRGLKPALRERYAAVFRIPAGDLERLPEKLRLPVSPRP